MPERDELIRNLRHLVDLDRASGVEFVAKLSPEVKKAPLGPALRSGGPALGPVAKSPIKTQVPVAPLPEVPSVSTDFKTSAPPDLQASPLTGLPVADLAAIAGEVAVCQRCKLCRTRSNTVPGEGNPSPELMFIGEGPETEEDTQAPQAGPAGQLLAKMIAAMGFTRDQVFITQVLKCPSPGQRTPESDEIAACLPYLERQIQILKPKVICTLGNTPLRALMANDKLGITKVRGQKLDWRGFVLIPTFHPSYLLRNETAKKPCWEDLLAVLKALGRTPPPRKTSG